MTQADTNRRLTIDGIKNSTLRRNVEEFTRGLEIGRGIFISGDVGTGKTVLATYLCWKLWDEFRMQFNLISVPEFHNTVAFSRFDPSMLDGIDLLKRCRLLVLDDIGSETTNDYFRCVILEIADFRYNNNLPIITTCNNHNLIDSRILRRLTYDNTRLVKATKNGYYFV